MLCRFRERIFDCNNDTMFIFYELNDVVFIFFIEAGYGLFNLVNEVILNKFFVFIVYRFCSY